MDNMENINLLYQSLSVCFLASYILLIVFLIKKQINNNTYFHYKFQYIFSIMLFENTSLVILNLSNISYMLVAVSSFRTKDIYCLLEFFSFITSTLLIMRMMKIQNKRLEDILFISVQSLIFLVVCIYAKEFTIKTMAMPANSAQLFAIINDYSDGVFRFINYIKFLVVLLLGSCYALFSKEDKKESLKILILFLFAYCGSLIKDEIRNTLTFFIIFSVSKLAYAYNLVFENGVKKKFLKKKRR